MELSILVACENSSVCGQIQKFAIDSGAKSMEIHKSSNAMEYIVSMRPQIVVLSENLAEMTAQEFIVLASQKKVFSTTTIILLTLHELKAEDKMKYMTLGFSYFMTYNLNEHDQLVFNKSISEEKKLINIAA